MSTKRSLAALLVSVLLVAGCAITPPTCLEARRAENPDFDAHGPRPEYPPMSRRLSEQGTARVEVLVSAPGYPEIASLEQSSGYPPLDAAAVEAVKNWCFVPAKKNGQPVAATVLVPLVYRLEPSGAGP